MANQNKNQKRFTRRTYAILAAVLLITALIGYLALRTMNRKALPGSAEAADDVAIAYNAEAQTVLLQLPYTLEDLPLAGSVTFRRPADNTLDFKLPFRPGRDMSQLVHVARLEKGLWKVSVFFTAGEESYYSEKAIHIK